MLKLENTRTENYDTGNQITLGWEVSNINYNRICICSLTKKFFPERLALLCHILRMMTEPEDTKHTAIQAVCLTLNKLEEITFESLSSCFGDKQSPKNQNMKWILVELFKVARQEARFRNHEIGKFNKFHHRNSHHGTNSIQMAIRKFLLQPSPTTRPTGSQQ